jgi:hypothetical protein
MVKLRSTRKKFARLTVLQKARAQVLAARMTNMSLWANKVHLQKASQAEGKASASYSQAVDYG